MAPNVRSTLRLTLVVLLAGILLGLLAPTLFASSDAAPALTYEVKAGDTLWRLASTYAPDEDPRRFVFEVQELNGLDGGPLLPGQKLIVPR